MFEILNGYRVFVKYPVKWVRVSDNREMYPKLVPNPLGIKK